MFPLFDFYSFAHFDEISIMSNTLEHMLFLSYKKLFKNDRGDTEVELIDYDQIKLKILSISTELFIAF